MTEDTQRNRRLWTVVVFLAVATMGAVLQVRGAVLPRLATDFGTPEWQLGLVAPAGTVGTLVVLLVVGLNAGRLGVRRSILAGLVGTALALLAMGLAPTFVVFLGAIVVRGAMNGVVRALARPLLSHFYATSRGRVYNYYDMVWAVGAATGPLGVVVAVALGSWRLVYAGLAAAVFVVAVLSWRLEAPSVTSNEEPLTRERARRLLRRPEVAGTLVVLFFITGIEGVLFTWLPFYASTQLPAGLAEVTLTVLLVSYIPGRLLSGALAERVDSLALAAGLVVALVPAVAFTFVLAGGLRILAGVGTVPALMGVLVDRVGAAAAMPTVAVPLGAALVALVVTRIVERRSPSNSVGLASED